MSSSVHKRNNQKMKQIKEMLRYSQRHHILKEISYSDAANTLELALRYLEQLEDVVPKTSSSCTASIAFKIFFNSSN